MGGSDVELGLLASIIPLLNFYPQHVGERPAHSAFVPLLPVSMDVVYFIPYLSDLHSARFLTVLSNSSIF